MEKRSISPIVDMQRPVVYTSIDTTNWGQIFGFHKMSKERTPLEYPDELRLKELLSEGIPMLIPKHYLFGRQENGSYDRKKRKALELAMQKDGLKFLFKEPIIVCALPNSHANGLSLVIIDGHHRTRYSGKFGVHNMPSLVYTPEQITEAMNIRNNTTFSPQSLTEKLGQEVGEAMASFKTLPDNRQPRIISMISSPNELPFEKFQIAS